MHTNPDVPQLAHLGTETTTFLKHHAGHGRTDLSAIQNLQAESGWTAEHAFATGQESWEAKCILVAPTAFRTAMSKMQAANQLPMPAADSADSASELPMPAAAIAATTTAWYTHHSSPASSSNTTTATCSCTCAASSRKVTFSHLSPTQESLPSALVGWRGRTTKDLTPLRMTFT